MRTPGNDEELALGFCLSEGMRPERAAAPGRSRREHRRRRSARLRSRAPAAELLRLLLLRRLREGRARGGGGGGAAGGERPPSPGALLVSLPERLREAQGAFAATGGLHATGLFDGDGHAAVRARGRGPPQRARQGARLGVHGGAAAARRVVLCLSGRIAFELVQKAAVAGCPIVVAVGAPSEPRRRAGGRPRHHALRLHARRADERLLRGLARRELTGVCSSAARRPASARRRHLAELDGETLAERGWRVLGELCEERLAVGKVADALPLPFRCSTTAPKCGAPIAGLVAGAASCIARRVRRAAGRLPARHGRAARRAGGRVRGPRRRRAADRAAARRLPAERVAGPRAALARGRLSIRDALTALRVAVVECDPELLANVNTPEELQRLR